VRAGPAVPGLQRRWAVMAAARACSLRAGARVRGCAGARVRGCAGARVRGCLSFRAASGGILSGLPDIRVNRRHQPGQDHCQPGGIVPGQQQQGSVAVPAAGQQQQRAIVGAPAAQLTATTSQRRCQDSNNKSTSL
jgi:hypothetical protein